MSNADRLRIIHISDIHFSWSFDLPLWEQVKSAIKAEEPDLLIVSGDFVESPFPLMLILARREITEFSQSLKVPLVTVPGNHDVAFAGNVRVWPFTRLYRAIFSGQFDNGSLRVFPTFTTFYRTNFLLRLLWRIWLYLLIIPLWITRFAFCGGSQDDVVQTTASDDASKPLCTLVGLDSNRSFFLAAGKVGNSQLTNLGSTVLGFKNRESLRKALECRILVVHHHLLPIPYMHENATDFEPFLVLRNAGTVLNEVWASGFDLVVHGHRHRSCFSRIAYGDGTENLRTIPVLAAASPTVGATSASGNSFNLIDIHPNGRLGIKVQAFGGGMNIRGVVGGGVTEICGLGIDELKHRNFYRALEVQGVYCEEYRRDIRIGHLGTTDTTVRVKGFTATHATVDSHPHRFSVDLGLIDPEKIHLVDESPGVCLRALPDTKPSVDVSVDVEVPSANVGVPVSYGIQYATANNFRLSMWECAEEQRLAEESASFRVKYPTKRLTLLVELPMNLQRPQPFLRCWRPVRFAHQVVDKKSRMVEPPSKAGPAWEPDHEATQHEAPNLINVGGRVWQLTIAYPMIGYKYEIAWKVKDTREVSVNQLHAGETITFRCAAVEYRAQRLSGVSPGQTVQNIRTLLHLLLDEFAKRYRSPDIQRETLRACLFSYDRDAEQAKRVVGIEEVVIGPRQSEENDPTRLAAYAMPLGQGVAGLCMKTANPNIYYKPDINFDGNFDVGFFEVIRKLHLTGVIAIPLYHPKKWEDLEELGVVSSFSEGDLPSIYETIGVITFASDSPATGIGHLWIPETDKKAKRDSIFFLTNLVQSAVPRLRDYLFTREQVA